MRAGPLVTSWKRYDICSLFFGSDILPCLTSNNLKTTHDDIIKIVVMHSAQLTKALGFYVIKT